MVDSAGVRCIGGTRTDRNGNQIAVSSRVITDTLGRQIPITMVSTGDTAGCTGSLPIASAYLWSPRIGGGTVSFKFCYANVQTSGYQMATGSVSMIRSVVLPDGTSYAFEYNDLNGTGNINYGSLTKITLPTGGTISYTYVDHGTNGLRYQRSKHSFRDDDHQPVCGDTNCYRPRQHTWNYLTGADPNGDVTTHQFSTPDSWRGL